MRRAIGLVSIWMLGAVTASGAMTPTPAPALPYAWVFVGEGLEKPVAIVGWESSERIMQGFFPTVVHPDALRGRQALQAAMLNQPDWEALGADPAADAVKGRATYSFYPASGDHPAVLVGAARSWAFSADASGFLAARGVLVRQGG